MVAGARPQVKERPLIRRPGQFERMVATSTLFILAYAVPTTWFRAYAGSFVASQPSDPITQLLFMGCYGYLLARLHSNEAQLVKAIRVEPLLFAWVGYFLLSAVWSEDTARTIDVSVIFLLTTLVGYYLFIRYELEEVLWMIMWVSLIGVVCNIIWSVGLPAYGQTALGWSGVQTDKNSLGRSSVFELVNLIMAARLFRRFRVLCYLGAAGSLFLMFGSTSGTSLGGGLALLGFMVLFQAFRGRKTLYGAVALGYVTATVTGIWVGLTSLEVVAGIVGKDVSLTGRTILWELVIDEIPNRLWLGSGAGAFWTDWFGPSHEIWIDFGGRLPHAHNALLEYMLVLGLIGTTMFMFMFVRAVVRATRYVRAVPGVIGLWPLTILTYTLLYSITEVGVQGRTIFWVAFILAVLTVARQGKVPIEAGYRQRQARMEALAALGLDPVNPYGNVLEVEEHIERVPRVRQPYDADLDADLIDDAPGGDDSIDDSTDELVDDDDTADDAADDSVDDEDDDENGDGDDDAGRPPRRRP